MKKSAAAMLLLICSMGSSSGQKAISSHPSTPDLVARVAASVVRIDILVTGKTPTKLSAIPERFRGCIERIPTCAAGTGLLVNRSGDVLTAAHVAQDVQAVIDAANTAGLETALKIGLAMPNAEQPMHMRGTFVDVPASIIALDPVHDVALLHMTYNPFDAGTLDIVNYGSKKKSKFIKPNPTTVNFDVQRLRDGEQIFGCGFPVPESELITTMGSVASAWSFQNVNTAKAAGNSTIIDVIQADLRINPGNSGGPLFRLADQAVLGIIVEVGPFTGGLATVIPSKYLTAFLDQYGIKWDSAGMPVKRQSRRK
jgi:S1-C subfamily serine protease